MQGSKSTKCVSCKSQEKALKLRKTGLAQNAVSTSVDVINGSINIMRDSRLSPFFVLLIRLLRCVCVSVFG